MGLIPVMRLCHYQSRIPENSIKSLLAAGGIRPCNLQDSPFGQMSEPTQIQERASAVGSGRLRRHS